MEGAATQRSELVLLKSEVQNSKVTIERLERELHQARSDSDALLQEKKYVIRQCIIISISKLVYFS